MIFQLVGLDVWGNEKDGFEVNDYYPQRLFWIGQEMPEFADIIKHLKASDFLVKRKIYASQYPYENMEVIEYKKTGEPLFQISKVDSENEKDLSGRVKAGKWVGRDMLYMESIIYKQGPSGNWRKIQG